MKTNIFENRGVETVSNFYKKHYMLFEIIIILALVLLLALNSRPYLNRYISSDEYSYGIVNSYDGFTLFDELKYNPPIYLVFVKFLTFVTQSIFVMRLAFLIFGIISLIVMYRFIRKEANSLYAIAASLFFVNLPLLLELFTTLRAYAPLMLFLILSQINLYDYFKTRQQKYIYLYVLFMLLSVYTHYTAYPILIAGVVCLMYEYIQNKNEKLLEPIALLVLVQLASLLLMIDGVISRSREYPSDNIISLVAIGFFIYSIIAFLISNKKINNRCLEMSVSCSAIYMIFLSLTTSMRSSYFAGLLVLILLSAPTLIFNLNTYFLGFNLKSNSIIRIIILLLLLINLFLVFYSPPQPATAFIDKEASNKVVSELLSNSKIYNSTTYNFFQEHMYSYFLSNVYFGYLGNDYNLTSARNLDSIMRKDFSIVFENKNYTFHFVGECYDSYSAGFYVYFKYDAPKEIRNDGNCSIPDIPAKCKRVEMEKNIYYCENNLR
jgi:hypothetical protein